MRFSRHSFMWLTVVLLLRCFTAAESGHQGWLQITVLVNNSARVSPSVLGRSEAEAERIFRAAGIQVNWVECQSSRFSEGLCSRVPSANQFVIHLVPTGRTSKDSVFGVAFLGENGTGKYCDVFFDRVENANNYFGHSEPELLGTVMAHELGHLLLGSQAHFSEGIMRPVWDAHSLPGIGMGKFLFTRRQVSLIKQRFQKQAEVERKESTDGD